MTTTDFLLLAIALLIAAFLSRLIFSIPTIVRNLETQTKILSRLAEKEGISLKDNKPKETGFFDH